MSYLHNYCYYTFKPRCMSNFLALNYVPVNLVEHLTQPGIGILGDVNVQGDEKVQAGLRFHVIKRFNVIKVFKVI